MIIAQWSSFFTFKIFMTLRDITIITYDCYEYAYFPVTLLALFQYLNGRKNLTLLLFLILVTAFRLTAIYLASNYINSIFLYHIIGFIELVFSFLIFREFLKKYWDYIFCIVVGSYVINSLFIASILEPNNIFLALVNLLVVLFGINYLRSIYRTEKIKHLNKNGFFFINAGFIIFAGGCFFLNLMMTKVISKLSNGFFENAWLLEVGFGILRLFLISYGLIILRREK